MTACALPAARAEILKRLEIHVLNEPSVARSLRNLEVRGPSKRTEREVHDHRARTPGVRRIAGNLIAIVLEIAGHDQLAFLGFRALHAIARRALRVSPQRAKRLDVLLLRRR